MMVKLQWGMCRLHIKRYFLREKLIKYGDCLWKQWNHFIWTVHGSITQAFAGKLKMHYGGKMGRWLCLALLNPFYCYWLTLLISTFLKKSQIFHGSSPRNLLSSFIFGVHCFLNTFSIATWLTFAVVFFSFRTEIASVLEKLLLR